MNVVSLHHGGDLGDTVYAIPALRRLAYPAHLTLYPNHGVTRSLMDEENASMILPLLNAQRGISADWKPTHYSDGLRLDFALRRFYHHGFNLADMCSHWVGHDHWPLEQPWMIADKQDTRYKIVVSRSARYRNSNFPWKSLYKQFDGRACFVGVPWEHQNFEEEIGKIDFVYTPSLLDVARLMAGADIFIGNQSCPRAVAESLKVPVIVEQSHPINTHFARECAFYPFGHGDQIPKLDDESLEAIWCHAAAQRSCNKSPHQPYHLELLASLCRLVRGSREMSIEIGVGQGGTAAVISWCLGGVLHLSDKFSDSPEDTEEAKRFLRVNNVEFFDRHLPSGEPKYSFVHVNTCDENIAKESIKWLSGKASVIAVSWCREPDVEDAIKSSGLNFKSQGNLAWHLAEKAR